MSDSADPFAFNRLPRGRSSKVSTADRPSQGLWAQGNQLRGHPKWEGGPASVIVGRDDRGWLCLDDDRHAFTVAGSRAGKGLSVILPNLAHYGGSVCVLDPKGENATLTAERRGNGRGVPAGGMGQEVHVIDPYGQARVDPSYRSGFNPLADLDPQDPLFVDECYTLADALVVASPKDTDDHWNSMSRLVLRGMIAWVASAPDGRRDLVEVRRLINGGPDDWDTLKDEMFENPERAYGVPAEMAAALHAMGENELGSVLSSTRKAVMFLSSPSMAACLSDTSRQPDLMAWKHGGQSVYLCLPAALMGQHARFFRLFLNRLFFAVERDPSKPAIPALLLLDEMHVLGHMSQLETAAALLAGYGLKIWSIWQDLNQLKANYGDKWETFIGNASLFQSFGLNDLTTLKHVSDRLGPTTVLNEATSALTVGQAVRGIDGKSYTYAASPLLTGDEVAFHFSRQSGNQAVLYPGAAPIWMRRVSYLDDDFKAYRETA